MLDDHARSLKRKDGNEAGKRARQSPFPEQARSLSTLEEWRSVAALLLQWGVIIAAIVLATHTGHGPLHWLVALAAIIIISGRQQALATLMHDAAHYRLFHNRALNNTASDLLCALPLGVVTSRYRQTHLQHHIEPLGASDPDWTIMQAYPREWGWPKTQAERNITFLRDAVGLGFLAFLQQWKAWLPQTNHFGTASSPEPFSTGTRLRIYGFYAVVLGAAFGLHLWPVILLYWLLPLATVFQVFFRIRTISEHMGCGPGTGMAFSRNVEATMLERLIIAPLNVNLHLTHHIFPGVPWYNLPKLTRLLHDDAQFASVAYVSPSYLGRDGVLRGELTTRQTP